MEENGYEGQEVNPSLLRLLKIALQHTCKNIATSDYWERKRFRPGSKRLRGSAKSLTSVVLLYGITAKERGHRNLKDLYRLNECISLLPFCFMS